MRPAIIPFVSVGGGGGGDGDGGGGGVPSMTMAFVVASFVLRYPTRNNHESYATSTACDACAMSYRRQFGSPPTGAATAAATAATVTILTTPL
ncbi:hypothetical protein RB195_013106 [Necator americanus]|uniref:Secreted protein n=1 Tax=Necator americanus TaxID=51031 RepID=A0ABR1DVH3_NECAM